MLRLGSLSDGRQEKLKRLITGLCLFECDEACQTLNGARLVIPLQMIRKPALRILRSALRVGGHAANIVQSAVGCPCRGKPAISHDSNSNTDQQTCTETLSATCEYLCPSRHIRAFVFQ